MSRNIYTPEFYRDLDHSAEPSARVVVPALLRRLKITSVVDLGCGDGAWLKIFEQNGVDSILGVDGSWVPKENLKIPLKCFHEHSLDQPFLSDKRFDLAMSLEVAEHLAKKRAQPLVEELTALAPIILFSAAIPGQGGVNHINEQWPSYWKELFARHDYVSVDILRREIWNEPNVTWWYKQNLILYISHHLLKEKNNLGLNWDSESEKTLDLVHPELWIKTLKPNKPSFNSFLRFKIRRLRQLVDN